VQAFGQMGVDMRWLVTCGGVHAVVTARKPIKGEVVIDPFDSKIVIKYDPPTEGVQLLTAKVSPVNFFVLEPMALRHLPLQRENYYVTRIWSRENVRTVAVEVSKMSIFVCAELRQRTVHYQQLQYPNFMLPFTEDET